MTVDERRERLALALQLERLFEAARDNNVPDRVKADLARHGCVLCSGYLEALCRETLHNYVARRAPADIVDIADSFASDFANPRYDKLIAFFRKLSATKTAALEAELDDTHSSAVGSVVSNRHNIAHGRSSSVNMAQVRDYFSRIRLLEKLVEKHFLT